ncbi:MAG: 3-phosphoshikimate 1-carboxyvinyltransferase [Opitutae bacterium]|nr:3-phosphoshikimate 1-carboxyvinyltransferase [Opitutae bacterium]
MHHHLDYPDPLPIYPFTTPVSGSVEVPGSKSITNRLLILAALSDQPVTLSGALFSDDSRLMVQCLGQLGIAVEINESKRTMRVQGTGGFLKSGRADLSVGLSGTTARFITALCATRNGGEFKVDGTPQMRRRPMKGLLDALIQQGCEVESGRGFLPVTLRPSGLRGGRIFLEASASSQLLSALLMVSPLAEEDLEIEVSGGAEKKPFVAMTQRLMYRFGQPPQVMEPLENGRVLLKVKAGKRYSLPHAVAVEPDASAASYFLTLPLVVGGSITVKGLHPEVLQGDFAYTEVLREAGLKVTSRPIGTRASLPLGQLPGLGVRKNFWAISDTFPTLSAITPLLKGSSFIEGIAHTRHQETDRVAAMEKELTKLGQQVDSGEDYLRVQPGLIVPSEVDPHGDHRMAMSLAILGCFNLYADGSPWMKIRNPACCAKTFPRFFEVLENLRNNRFK